MGSDTPAIGVIAGRQRDGHWYNTVRDDPFFLLADPEESRRDFLQRVLDHDIEVVAVAGGDAVVGELLGLHRRRIHSDGRPLRLVAMRAGRVHRVADVLGGPVVDDQAFGRLKRAFVSRALNRRLVPTLEITSSARPAGQCGFSFGTGLFYQLFEAYHRAGATAVGTVTSTLARVARQTIFGEGQRPASAGGRMTIDGRPQNDDIRYVVASSLATTWLGLRMDEESATVRVGRSPASLAAAVAQSRTLGGLFGNADPVRSFKRVHLDGTAGYVVDGELFEPACPHVVQVQAGPIGHFVTF